METRYVLLNLRKQSGLSQEQMAERIMVTWQAVSRWENGDTVPGVDTLRIISKEFDLSINTLLGSPRKLFCQCCGMPLDEDASIDKDSDGCFDEDYCKWCYENGEFAYPSMESLMDFSVPHMAAMHQINKEDIRQGLKQQLPKLKHWQK